MIEFMSHQRILPEMIALWWVAKPNRVLGFPMNAGEVHSNSNGSPNRVMLPLWLATIVKVDFEIRLGVESALIRNVIGGLFTCDEVDVSFPQLLGNIIWWFRQGGNFDRLRCIVAGAG